MATFRSRTPNNLVTVVRVAGGAGVAAGSFLSEEGGTAPADVPLAGPAG